jgi:tryptophan synthase alpha chain
VSLDAETMNRIDAKFTELRAARKKAFIAFITAGDPSLPQTVELVLALEKAGADIIELGVPFSDPLADGPTIQNASFRALRKGTTLPKILAAVKKIRQSSDIPLALMTYYNPVFHFGEPRFVRAAKAAGVDGLIIPDLPVEEAGELRRAALDHDLSTVFFLAPTTAKARMPLIVRASTGFIYFLSVTGVTGARTAVPADLKQNIRLARRYTNKPICVGFGISTPQQVRSVAGIADGVIVGSAIVKEIEKNALRADLVARVAGFVQTLTRGLS